LFEKIAKLLPPGMKIIGGASGGPFEHASFMVGLEPLCIKVYEDEEFVTKLFEKIGKTIVGIAERLSKMDAVGVYRFGDDLGYKTTTMLSPKVLRQYVFPWQKKVVEAAHRNGKPFLLHSCGQLQDIMDDLIDDVKIDAKHSIEDAIMPVQEWKKRYGGRIGIVGGVDLDKLCRLGLPELRKYVRKIIDDCSPGGHFAIGSGNSIPDYVPVENLLTMLDEALR
jgi:uroporphyrinogen decarboxylase